MSKNKTDRGYLYIKAYSPYVEGTVGKDIKLSLWQKLQIMFSKGISVVFIGRNYEKGNKMLKVPQINWIPFDKNNPPILNLFETYLILIREDNYNNGATWHYSMDVATPYGSYIDNFWDTENDWVEGQCVEVVAYAEFPCYLKESELVDVLQKGEK